MRILCSGEPEVRELVARRLVNYHWREPAHEAIFGIIMSFPATGSPALREQLPARLTRRGFPDFEFPALFESSDSAAGELEQLVGKLRGET